MNLNQILNMAIRMIMRRGINAGINRGLDMASRRGKPNRETSQDERESIEDNRNNT